ncbi:MAG: hypothetical protein SFY32_13205 [Bacteroidota bacterium]|nr:hypothetical protein [Bacteroidota bacterium]
MKFKYIAVILFFISARLVNGQGCSDAGFCTMGAMRPNQHFVKNLNVSIKSAELSQYLGVTKFHDNILVTTLDVNVGINTRTSFQVKVPYMYIIGPLGVQQGVSDLSVSASRILWASEKSQFNFTLGTKIPTGEPNKVDSKGKPLPMYNQVTLGTYDIVAGFSFGTRGWLFAAGYQQPLNTANNNFKWGVRKGDKADSLEAAKYPISDQIIRGNDIMFRVEKNFRFSRFNAYVGLLPIYRLNKDKIKDPKTGKIVEVEGSDGLALTGLVGGGYRFSYTSGLKFLFGYALVKRKLNPDGLSREYVMSIGYEYRF